MQLHWHLTNTARNRAGAGFGQISLKRLDSRPGKAAAEM